jgi:hypothetical protein
LNYRLLKNQLRKLNPFGIYSISANILGDDLYNEHMSAYRILIETEGEKDTALSSVDRALLEEAIAMSVGYYPHQQEHIDTALSDSSCTEDEPCLT